MNVLGRNIEKYVNFFKEIEKMYIIILEIIKISVNKVDTM